ncbi:MAG: choice-of-anchor J domain-containing protein [Muribaculaceae bacterium]|nr:choice-of-anchor J domain-containing protein [Muribaculaceae bacterium]
MKKFLISLAMGVCTLATALLATAPYANADEQPVRKSVYTTVHKDQAKAGERNLFRQQQMREQLRHSKSFLNYRQSMNPDPIARFIPQARVAAECEIIGTVINATNWGSDEYGYPAVKYGIYSMKPASDNAMTELALDKNMCANGGGVLVGDSYYVFKYYTITGDYYLTRLYQYDATTWEELSIVESEVNHVSNDMTYDPVTKKVYGCFFSDDMTQCVWATFDLATATRTIIAPLAEPMKAVAANKQGEIYAIGNSGNLYKVDKATGNLTTIGNTGVTPYYLGSGVIDHRTGVFYWFAYPEDNTAHLYTVDLKTAALTEVCEMANYEEVVGAVIRDPLAEDGAPDWVTNLTANFEGTSHEGTLTFTMPTVTYAGTPMESLLDYTVYLDDEIYARGYGFTGMEVEVPVEIDNAPRMCEFTVYASNDAGDGVKTSIQKWVGADVPKAVENIRLRKGAGNFDLSLTWDAPSATVNDGALEGNLNYTVVRYPGEVIVAQGLTETSFSETVQDNGNIVKYYYDVIAYGGTLKGETATSNKVALGMTAVPYLETFDSASDLDTFTVVNANDDDQTWQWYEGSNWIEKICYVRCKYSLGMETPMDDWLITPGIKLQAGKIYEFGFKAQTQYYVHVERLCASFGTAPDPEAMTTQLLAPTDITLEEFGHKFNIQFHVPADGVYYFGIHGCSDADKYFLGVDDIFVNEGPSTSAPAAITDLVAKADENGEYKATLTFTAPDKDLIGGALTALDGVDIYRGDKKIATVTPQMGNAVTYVDENPSHGFNTYKVVPFNTHDEGFSAETKVFVGYDVPNSPTGVSATTQGNDVLITWNAPTTGANGGYINQNAMTYTIKTIKGVLVAEGLTSLSYTDTPMIDKAQDIITYYVYAVTSAGTSLPASANRVIVGDAYTLPFKESFPNADETYYPWTVESIEGGAYAAWYTTLAGVYPSVAAQDGDNGLVSFIANAPGYEARYMSPRITLGGVEHPTLEFYYYFLQGCQDCSLKVEVSANGGAWEQVSAIDMNLNEGGTGWYKHSVGLEKYKDEESIRIALRGRCDDPNPHYTHVDNIQVRNVIEHDLRMTKFDVPVRVQVGKQNIIKVGVENIGGNTASGYTVDLYSDDNLVASVAGPDLTTDYYTIVEIDYQPTIDNEEVTKLHAVINYAADLDLSNNRSADQFAFVIMPDYPAVDDLTASAVGNEVELNWSEPDPVSAEDGIRVTDDMEDYESFIIENIGKWSLYDGNGTMTYGINNVLYPHINEPAAFQVFNPSEIGLSGEYWDAYSGDQMLVSWAVGPLSAENPTVPATDHWLISPLLPGNAQTISFMVKSPTDTYGLESFSVYYSTTGVAKENFSKIVTSVSKAPLSWTEVTIDLPEGAKYFAIVHDSQDTYALMVDDITYISAAEQAEELGLIGYNIYRNGVKITAEPIVENFYIDTVEDPTARYAYKVTVVYDKGESAYSNEVVINPASVGGLATDDIRVIAGNGQIRIENAGGQLVRIYSADGKTVFAAAVETREISVEAGVYAVTIGSQTLKVRVK